jgi:tetratricopeptide (TPR) repeat protein
LHRLLPRFFLGRRAAMRERLIEAVRASELLVQVLYYSQETWPGVLLAMRALNLAEEAGDSPELARTYGQNCLAAGVVPLPRLARAYAVRALATARACEQPPAEAYVLEMVGVLEAGLGGFVAARAALERGAELGRRLRDERRAEECTSNLGVVVHHQGDFDGSVALFREVAASAQGRGDVQAESWGLLGQARNDLARGDCDSTLRWVDAARAHLERRPERFDRPAQAEVYALSAAALLRLGRLDAARREAVRVLEVLGDVRPVSWYSTQAYGAAAEVAMGLLEAAGDGASQSDVELAHRACALASRFASVFPIGVPQATLWQGLLAWARGRHRRARAAWRAGLAQAERLGMPWERGLALYEIGRHWDAGDPRRAECLTAAIAVFREIGARRDLARAEAAAGG